MPSKSMLEKSNHDFKGKYPHVCVGTLVSMHITDNRFQLLIDSYTLYRGFLAPKSYLKFGLEAALCQKILIQKEWYFLFHLCPSNSSRQD